MSRWYFLGPFLALHVLGGCGGDGDVQPTLSTGLELTFAEENRSPCGEAGWQPIGKPAHIVVRAALVTESCRCAYTAAPQWSCSAAKECESAYDLGDENPTKCHAVGQETVIIEGASASTNRSDCVVAVTFDANSARAAVQCSAPGDVSVYVTVLTNKGPKPEYHHVQFLDPETQCAPADAGAGPDAGDAGEDAADAAPPADAEAADADDPDAQDH